MYNVCWGGIIYMEGAERAITHMGRAERGIYTRRQRGAERGIYTRRE